MPEIIQNIYDYDGRIIHPITSVNAIVTEDGQNLDSYIDDKITSGITKDVPSNRLIPEGGETGQVLMKKSGSNYDVSWVFHEVDIPVQKLIGTIDKPIILSELTSGVYRIVGNNYIVKDDVTYFVDASGANLYIRSETDKNVVKITAKNIIVYTFTDDGSYTTNRYITQDEVENVKKEIISSIPTKLSELENNTNFVTRDDVDAQITEQINNGKIGEVMDMKISEAIGPISDEDIANLFK